MRQSPTDVHQPNISEIVRASTAYSWKEGYGYNIMRKEQEDLIKGHNCEFLPLPFPNLAFRMLHPLKDVGFWRF